MKRRSISSGRFIFLTAAMIAAWSSTDTARSQSIGTDDRRTLVSALSFDALVARVEAAMADNGMGLVAQASASQGASSRGIRIPGNAVLMVFRNDVAVRMLRASVPAGIEAPLRLYVTENADGTARLTYRTPSAIFSPYQNRTLDEMAKQLAPIFERIARGAVGG